MIVSRAKDMHIACRGAAAHDGEILLAVQTFDEEVVRDDSVVMTGPQLDRIAGTKVI